MNTLDFSETIVAYDLKVGRCRQLIELCRYVSNKVISPRSFTYAN